MTVRLLPHHIQHRVDELCTLGKVFLRSLDARASLPEHKVVWPEQPSRRSRTDAVHGSRLEVHENRTEHVAATGGFIAVHVDALQLEIRVTVVRAYGVDAVLVRDDLPELGPDLIVALTVLDMDELAHDFRAKDNKERIRPGYLEVLGQLVMRYRACSALRTRLTGKG